MPSNLKPRFRIYLARHQVLSVLSFATSAMFLGLGLGRFAFSPIVPELVEQGWFSADAVQAIAAANLIGYLLGALAAGWLPKVFSERTICLLSGIAVVVSYAALLLAFGEVWFWSWRLLSGVGGALLMVIGTAAAGRELTRIGCKQFQPLVFVGIGLGVLFVALGLPTLLACGLGASLAGLTFLSAGAVMVLWVNSGFLRREKLHLLTTGQHKPPSSSTTLLIILAYGCDALGFVMHTIYLPDMLPRSYGHSEVQVALSWAWFGTGACLAPAAIMLLRRWVGPLDALWAAYLLKATGVALVLTASDPNTASLSLFIVGIFTPGLVILTSSALSSITRPDRYLGLWGAATATFAFCQMGSGMAIAAVSESGYQLALLASVGVLAVGAALTIAARLIPAGRKP
jgi:MFS family permease